ncbi:hypothetical protein A9404_11845 [Halothiobacillus diazotrophicus]|uniref:Diguanylate cyclase DosC n=1 Tax=Halothiobacillus diazotrophicus TaxID=1860122 RepID=A0A191ZJD3_9GAMM|nr:EAL domain-containing protein [Halothiobacillus diazotrophicus]ANJ67975.1 hypothetical protein A9404_11845 [Halothiobacillus diazotrophicus]
MTISDPLNPLVESERVDAPQESAALQRLQEQLERQQALMQSLLGQIGTLMSTNDEQELLDVVCTQLLATGLFLGAWVARTRPDEPASCDILAAGGDGMTLLSDLGEDARSVWAAHLNQVQSSQTTVIEPGTDLTLIAPWQDVIFPGFSTTLIFVPITRASQPWAVLIVLAQHEGPLDRLLTEMLGRLGELLSNAFDQLDLRARLVNEREQAAFLAHHDALTGLTNRRGIDEALPKAMARARRNQRNMALVMLDLDDFKPINDRFGHATGDALLQALAQRIKSTLRETDMAARLGGDEFLLLIESIEQKKHLKKTLERINHALTEPVELPEGPARVRASMGVALFPQDDCEPEQLIRNADAALYLCKNKKRGRKHNWCIWNDNTTDDLEQPVQDLHTPPYGMAAANLLQRFVPQLGGLVEDFVNRFYAELQADPDARKIILQLSEAEFTHLKARQSVHLQQLLDPELTEAMHRSTAKHVGEIHALIGLTASSLVRAMTIYLHQFDTLIAQHRLTPQDHSRLELVLTERLSIELSEELESEHAINNRYQQILLDIDAMGRQPLSWQEFNERLLSKLRECPGVQASWIGAPDADGVFIINFSEGVEAFSEAMQAAYGGLRMPRIAPGEPEMAGSTARAFRQAQIQSIASFSTAPEAEPWRTAALNVGIRSSVGIPITDEQRRPLATLTLYGDYPNMFETPFRQSFCQQLGFIVSQTWQQFKQTQIVNTSIEELDLWRQAFYGMGLKLVYQPIIGLASGRIEKVEALARLRLEDGRIIMPGAFIPRLNEQQIIQLFRMGLEQGLRQLVQWDRELPGSALGLALNLPLEALADNDCPNWVHDALLRHGIPASRLTLEMLEHHEMIDVNQSQRQMRTLSDMGVQLAMDDLGAGYSNLIRLNNLPFDTVKIDQALIRSAYSDPVRIIKFIGALIHMTHALDLNVVAEGLETPDLIEVARILGADLAQGYAIAHPLYAEDFLTLYRAQNALDEQTFPHTALGAIATQWQLNNPQASISQIPSLGAVNHCPIHQFIVEQGLLGSELDMIHRELHDSEQAQGRNSATFHRLLHQLQTQLAALVSPPTTLQ